MTGRSRWLVLALTVAVLAAGILLWRSCRQGAERPVSAAGEFGADQVALISPDLDLELVSVRATAKSSYTDWSCLFECRERGGCSADVRIRISFVADGEDRMITLGGQFDAARGETVRIGRVQRPAIEVERVNEVAVEVASALADDGPRPTPVR
jgi:hypothetical protein